MNHASFTKRGIDPLFFAGPECRIMIVGQAPGLVPEKRSEAGAACVALDAGGHQLGDARGIRVLLASDPRLAGHRHVPVEVLRTQGKNIPRGRRTHRETAQCAVPARGSQRLVGGVTAGERGVARLDGVDQSIDLARREEAFEGVVLLVVTRREGAIRIVGRENDQRRCSLAVALQLVDDG